MRHICSASEAIREGIKLWPEQCFNKFFEGDRAACATGAMIGAVLGRALTAEERQRPRFREVTAPVAKMFDYLKTWVPLPCGCEYVTNGPTNSMTGYADTSPTLYNVAVHLNNEHRWSREQIADWLESEEEKLGFVTLVESEEVAVQR